MSEENKTDMIKLGEVSFVMDFTYHGWTGKVTDKELKAAIAEKFRGKPWMSDGKLLLWPKESLSRIGGEISKVKRYVHLVTAPWRDGGMRIMASETAVETVAEIRKQWQKVDAVLDEEFIVNWSDNLDRLKVQNGDKYDDDYYFEDSQPRSDEFISRFWLETNPMPITQADHFVMKIEDENFMKALKKSAEVGTDNSVKKAMVYNWNRLLGCAQAFAEMNDKCGSEKGDKFNKQRTMVSNVRELTEALPALNLLKDGAMNDKIGKAKAWLCKQEWEVLRDDLSVRSQVRAQARQLVMEVTAAMQKAGLA